MFKKLKKKNTYPIPESNEKMRLIDDILNFKIAPP